MNKDAIIVYSNGQCTSSWFKYDCYLDLMLEVFHPYRQCSQNCVLRDQNHNYCRKT